MAALKTWTVALALGTCSPCSFYAQTSSPTPLPSSSTTPLAFETVSIKPAPPGSRPSGLEWMMRGYAGVPPRGLIRLTLSLSSCISVAFHLQNFSELSSLRTQLGEGNQPLLYTIVARPSIEITDRDQFREMLRALLAERFALRLHEDLRRGPINRIVLAKPAAPGPQLKPHTLDELCVRPNLLPSTPAHAATPADVLTCGITLRYGPGPQVHMAMVDYTLDEIAKQMVGMAAAYGNVPARPVVDATGLTGRFDATLDFHLDYGPPGNTDPSPEDAAPPFEVALRQQLGLRIEHGTGSIHTLVVDHISPLTPD